MCKAMAAEGSMALSSIAGTSTLNHILARLVELLERHIEIPSTGLIILALIRLGRDESTS